MLLHIFVSCREVGLTWLHEPCREMLSYGLISESIPERLHPKSFRSTFEINTHVWATRQQRYVPYVKVGGDNICLQYSPGRTTVSGHAGIQLQAWWCTQRAVQGSELAR